MSMCFAVFFFKQKTAYEMRISDWSSDVCSSDLIEATLKASEISRDRVEDARNVLKEGEEVEAKIISIDRKSRVISLSIKSKDVEDEKDAMKEIGRAHV